MSILMLLCSSYIPWWLLNAIVLNDSCHVLISFSCRITNMQAASKQPALVLPPQGSVQMRIKTANSGGERLSQTKSMVIPEPETPGKPVSFA